MLGPSVSEGDTKSVKEAYGSSFLATYILLSDGTPAPMWVCSGKQLQPFSHLGLS